MIIKLFKHKGPSASAVNYCISDYDHKKKLREVKPEVLLGDVEYTKSLDSIAKKATSGVIAFRDNEKPTRKQMLDIIEKFEKTFIGTELRDKVNCLYIIHREKGNTEIHFIINNIVLDEQQKTFNPFPPYHQKLKDAFVAKINFEMGYEQVIEKELLKKNKTLTNDERKASSKGENGFYNLTTKIALEDTLYKAIADREITNRKELIEFIKNDLGLELSRVNDNSISIKSQDPSKKNIRLSGGIYSTEDNKSYALIQKEMREKAEQPFNLEEVNKVYLREMNKRASFNKRRFGTIDDKRGYDTSLTIDQVNKAEKEVINTKRLNQLRKQQRALQPLPVELTNLPTINQDQQQEQAKTDVKNDIQQTPTTEVKADNSTTSSNNISLDFSNSAEQQLANAVAQLNSARTPAEYASARLAVSNAQTAVAREKNANEEKRKKALEQAEIIRKLQLNNSSKRL